MLNIRRAAFVIGWESRTIGKKPKKKLLLQKFVAK